MSTLAEIESAAELLPVPQQELLLHRLEMKLRGSSEGGVACLVLEEGMPMLVAPVGAPEMTPEVVKAALADFP